MRQFLRRIRGAIGIGLVWGFVSSLVGMIPRWVLRIETDAPFAILFGMFGFVAGVTFSLLVALTHGRRRLDEVSIRKFAGLGALGGTLMSSAFAARVSLGATDALLVIPTFAAACAACASATLWLARRSAARELPAHRRTHALDDQADDQLLIQNR